MGALGLFLLAVGAILRFAVSDQVGGVDLATIGTILMVVGSLGFLASIFTGTFTGLRRHTERTVSADGRTVVEDERTTSV